MDTRIVKRIKLKKLYSEPEIFNPIEFSDGVNIILGEKSDSTTTAGRKTNGVGKSMCIEFINFCLLKKYSDSRIALIPKNVLDESVTIKLDLEIGREQITISRNRLSHEQPTILKDGKDIHFESIEETQRFLKDLLYVDLKDSLLPSFRELLSPLIRDERSEFKSILESFDVSKKIPVNYVPHLFFLSVPLDVYKKTRDTVKKIEDVKNISKNSKREVTNNNQKKISDVKAELNALNDDIKNMSDAIESFKSNESFNSLEKELIHIEDAQDKLRIRAKSISYELQKINSLPKPETIETEEVEFIYNKFRQGLGDFIVRSLEETLLFKEKIESFQRSLINQRAAELREEYEEISIELRRLDDLYSGKLSIIDQRGVLKNLKSSLRIYHQKTIDYSKKIGLFREYEAAEKEKKALNLQKTQEVIELDKSLEDRKKIIDSFIDTLLDIHYYIMGNKECSFTIDTINNTSKQTIEIDLRIFDDGSHSVDRTKVFIYDMALLFNQHTRNRHPGFLIHDNIFDVDQDTLVQSLNLLAREENLSPDFQYILTLNRDKIEHEENQKQIKLNIEGHKVAVFTKQNKFLNKNYQELQRS
ncbi:hypothetical protein PCCS19_36160 [Paenibacillus sp. CCS19]|uniref:DUF2326 domain-containing protein n=1 Tax=Paenibacillus sp. CCS19 TaxID=3158387 RepID=UPI002564B914|nr:DUF2326 domain-containing protein [Paenibacillus cellulosilyticus]GMK40560.1 hypothetical protein PCCS19_36160 [Paenibacillus cellulosilyticus]